MPARPSPTARRTGPTVVRPLRRRRGVPTRARRARRRAATVRPADRPPTERRPTPTSGGGSSPSLRWVPWIVLALIAAAFIVSSLAGQQLVEGRPHVLGVHERGRRRQRQEHRLQQVERRDQRQVRRTGRRQVGVLELGAEGQPPRHDARDDQEEGHRLQLRRRRQQHPRRHPAVGPAPRADHRALRVDEPARAGTDGRGHEHRQEPGQGLQHREAEDDVRRRRRLRPGEAGDLGGRRLPEEPGQVQGDRRAHPQGCAARRSSRHRQDPHRTRGRR